MISTHPGVQAVTVIGIPDEHWGERPCALVIPRNAECSPASIVDHLQQYVAGGAINKWAIPKEVRIVTEIPTTSVGKIDKKRIRAQLA